MFLSNQHNFVYLYDANKSLDTKIICTFLVPLNVWPQANPLKCWVNQCLCRFVTINFPLFQGYWPQEIAKYIKTIMQNQRKQKLWQYSLSSLITKMSGYNFSWLDHTADPTCYFSGSAFKQAREKMAQFIDLSVKTRARRLRLKPALVCCARCATGVVCKSLNKSFFPLEIMKFFKF